MSADFPDPPAFTTGDVANPAQLVTKLQQMRDLLLRITGSTGPNKGMTAWAASGVGGGSSSTTIVGGGGGGTGGTPDLTPPPTPTGFGASAAISNVIVTCDSQVYTAGGGHLFSRVYGATYSGSGPLPTFGSAVLIDTFSGTVDAIAENPATEWHLWMTWVTKAGVESTSPAGGTNGVTATTGQDVSLLLTALTGQITQSQLFSSLGTRINLIDAPAGTAGSVNARVAAEASTRSTDDGKLFAQYTVKIDVNGYVSGFGLASTLVGATPTSAFIVRADSFSIASPSGPGIAPITPFIVRTTSTTINGVVVPVGVYMDAAYIENGTITNAKIGNLQVDDAKIASANVAKLTAGSLQVGSYIRSTTFVAGTSGWTINADGTAELGAASIRGQLTAAQIDTRNLTIKDSAGTVIFSSGTVVPISLLPQNVQNNLLDCSWWKVGTAVNAKGWDINPGATDTFVAANNAQGESEILWHSVADSSGGGSGSGGWNPNGTNSIGFDSSKTYRFVIPIFRTVGSSGSSFWGIQGSSVCDLNTTSVNANPYFVNGTTPPTGRWCLYVGYVYPYGSTGNTNLGAGVYDMTTGALLTAGLNYNWTSPAIVTAGTRAYQFYASAGSLQWFGKPRVELVDGSETPLAGILAAGSISARNPLNSGNASTFIANAAIGSAQIGTINAGQVITSSLSVLSPLIGTLRNASSGQRMEIQDNRIRIYDSSNVLRVKIGDLS